MKFLDEIKNFNIENVKQALKIVGDKGPLGHLPMSKVGETPIELPDSHIFNYLRPNAKQETEIVKIKTSESNPALVRYREAIKIYFDRSNISYQTLDAFLDNLIPEGGVLKGSEFPIQTLDDFFAFQKIRTIDFKMVNNKWNVTRLERKISNDWITCKDFEITRHEEIT